MTTKRTKKPENKIFIERILVDPKDGACFVVMSDSSDATMSAFEFGRYNIQMRSSGKVPTKFFFNVKENEKMWIRVNDDGSIFLLDVGLRSPKDIEFLQKIKI